MIHKGSKNSQEKKEREKIKAVIEKLAHTTLQDCPESSYNLAVDTFYKTASILLKQHSAQLPLPDDGVLNRESLSLVDEICSGISSEEPILQVFHLGRLYEMLLSFEPVIENGSFQLLDSQKKRKSSGRYYTPKPVIDLLLKEVFALTPNKSFAEIVSIKLLDPAMGCGYFLISAIEHLLKVSLQAAERDGREDIDVESLKVAIASNSVYGVDVDPLAVQVTKRLFQIYTGSDREFDNLLCTNSLLCTGHKTAEPSLDIQSFWKELFPDVFSSGGFDLLVTNPPYVGQKDNRLLFERLLASPLKDYCEGKMDLWYLFVPLSINLLKKDGVGALLVTDYWTEAEGGRKLRRTISNNIKLKKLINFQGSVFPDAQGIHSQIVLFSKGKSEDDDQLELLFYQGKACQQDYSSLKEELFDKLSVPLKLLPKDGSSYRLPKSATEEPTEFEFTSKELLLGSVCQIYQGVVPGPDVISRKLWLDLPKQLQLSMKIGDSVFVIPSDEVSSLNLTSQEKQLLKPFYRAKDIKRYLMSDKALSFILYLSSETLSSLDGLSNIERHLE
ncbi:MAG: N-6 DNA methylase [Blastocatellia bacterium]|nr:N-6 DNA methylase [Blastocatellia bacterium]